MVINLKANEMVIRATDSHYITEKEYVKGKFIVTNQRIYFILSSDSNNSYYNIEIVPQQIKEVIFIKGKKLFSKGLRVLTHDGKKLQFIMKKRNEFGKLINSMY